MLENLEVEELILGDQQATYEGLDEDGNVILHMEDGSYKTLSTEEIYSHLNRDHDDDAIEEIVGHEWAMESGKLLVKVKWHTGEVSLLDANLVKEDNPLMLARYILEHPVEKLRNQHWATWAKRSVKNINRNIRHLRTLYDYEDGVHAT